MAIAGAAGSYRVGSGEPLVLIHGFSGAPLLWRPVESSLASSFDVLVVALAGHVGGASLAEGRAASVAALTDQVEREMDEGGFQTAHIVGNSLGGWIALELASRGRARSVVGLAPAGGWVAGSREEKRLKGLFTRSHAMTTRTMRYLPSLLSRPRLRRLVLGQAMARGDRIPAADALAMAKASVECPIYFDLMDAILRDGPPVGFEGIDCPVLLAWGEKDRILPLGRYSTRMRELVPTAEWVQWPGLGHIPMGDDAELVAAAIADFALRVPLPVA
jgi:pimeloyl-ACP methyl ester carboxylesterase